MKWRHPEGSPATCHFAGGWAVPGGIALPEPQPQGWKRAGGCSRQQHTGICWKEEQMPLVPCWLTVLLPSSEWHTGLVKMPQQKRKDGPIVIARRVLNSMPYSHARQDREKHMIHQVEAFKKTTTAFFCKSMHEFQKFHELWDACWLHIPTWNMLEHILKTSHTTKNIFFSFENNLSTSFKHAQE